MITSPIAERLSQQPVRRPDDASGLRSIQTERLVGASQVRLLQLAPLAAHKVMARDDAAGLEPVLLEADPETAISKRRDLHGGVASGMSPSWWGRPAEARGHLCSSAVIRTAGMDRLGPEQLFQQ